MYVFGRNDPCRAAEAMQEQRAKTSHSGTFKAVPSFDEESSTGGNWLVASEATRKRLDRKLKQKRELVLYPLARYEFTHVLKDRFNQGQLALLLNVPTENDLAEKRAIEVYKGPSGVKHFPPAVDCTPQHLRSLGWQPVLVPYDMTPSERIGKRLQARRTQYGLKPRVSSTIHACMGSTLPSIVTAVVAQPSMPYNFGLWEAAQVVVLLSRTRRADNIYFVGEQRRTITHLLEVLRGQQHRFLPYITSLLGKLCMEDTSPITPVYRHPTKFRPKDALMTSSPGVYLIISTRQPHFLYIGESTNIGARLTEHNMCRGPPVTARQELIPFAMFAYVVGFRNKRERQRFEQLWKVTAQRRRTLARNNNGLVEIGRDLVESENVTMREEGIHSRIPLRIIQCGTVVNENNI